MNRTVKGRILPTKKQPVEIMKDGGRVIQKEPVNKMELIRTAAVLIMVPVQIGLLLHAFGVL